MCTLTQMIKHETTNQKQHTKAKNYNIFTNPNDQT